MPPESDYVGTKDIAEDMGLKRRYVTNKVVKRPDFPKPKIRLTQKTTLWLRRDYQAWKQRQEPRTK